MGDVVKTYKVVLIGDSAVGKTSLVLRFVKGQFISTTGMTTQVDTVMHPMTVDGVRINLNIWDTVGHESYDSITANYYNGAAFGIVVYDVTSEESFDSAQNWIDDVCRYAAPNVQLAVVGNKTDLREKQVVHEDNAKALADKHKHLFFQTSAKEGTNVQTLFEEIARAIVKCSNQSASGSKDVVQLLKSGNSTRGGNNSSGCCRR
ncbi:hypothetical protein EMCRGX_G020450 [Ephydatia muelleri]|eukprot:Em0016g379a